MSAHRTGAKQRAFELVLPYPPSANSYWRFIQIGRRSVVVLSREAKDYKKRVADLCITNLPGPREPAFTGPVRIELDVYRPRRVGDLDNTLKVLLDSLKGIAWVDDSQVVELEASRFDDKENPRAVVRVTAAEVDQHALALGIGA